MTARGPTPCRLGAIASAFGESLPLEASPALQGRRRDLMFLQMMGFARYSREERGVAALAGRALAGSIARSGLPASAFDAVVYGTTTFGAQDTASIDRKVARALIDNGLGHAYPIGVFLSQCNTLFAALRVARGLLHEPEVRHVLVVVADGLDDERTRVRNLAMHSDGAAACVLSRADEGPGEFLLHDVQVGGHPNTVDLIDPVTHQFDPQGQARYDQGVRDIAAGLEARSGLTLRDCPQVILPNYTLSALRHLASLAGVAFERVFTGNVARFGHAFSADCLVNLADWHATAPAPAAGARVALLGTGMSFWGGALVEPLATTSHTQQGVLPRSP